MKKRYSVFCSAELPAKILFRETRKSPKDQKEKESIVRHLLISKICIRRIVLISQTSSLLSKVEKEK